MRLPLDAYACMCARTWMHRAGRWQRLAWPAHGGHAVMPRRLPQHVPDGGECTFVRKVRRQHDASCGWRRHA